MLLSELAKLQGEGREGSFQDLVAEALMSVAAASDAKWVSACFGKQSYATASGAHNAMKRMRRRAFEKREGKERRLTVYRCPYCHHHHIGSTAW